MDEKSVISKTIEFVKTELYGAEAGHDFWHVFRVWNLAKNIGKEEKIADMFVIELGSLLHDIADYKFHDGDETIGPKKAREFLVSLNVDEKTIEHVVSIIENISF